MELSKENRNSEHVSGLGGWLILAQVGLWSTFLNIVINIFFNILPIFRTGRWEELTDAASSFYNRLWPIIIPYELAGSIVLLGALIFAFVLFYRKKRKLPLMLIYFYLAFGLYTLINYFMIRGIPEIQDAGVTNPMTSLIRTLLTCAIWMSYFGKSVRVRNTFIK